MGMLQQHTGNNFMEQDLTKILTEKGYTYDYHDLYFEWLFKECAS